VDADTHIELAAPRGFARSSRGSGVPWTIRTSSVGSPRAGRTTWPPARAGVSARRPPLRVGAAVRRQHPQLQIGHIVGVDAEVDLVVLHELGDDAEGRAVVVQVDSGPRGRRGHDDALKHAGALGGEQLGREYIAVPCASCTLLGGGSCRTRTYNLLIKSRN
jgi:hypothetical protein